MRTRTFIALFLAAVVTSISATPTQRAANNNPSIFPQTTTIPMLTGTTQPINNGVGNQTYPRVACNLASYTNDDLEGSSTIKYLDFATNTEHVVPGNTLDRLSDTDGQRIAFTQFGDSGDQILIYDVASQTTISIPGSRNSQPAIGGNLIAFLHSPILTPWSQLQVHVYDQNTGSVTPLTNDTLSNLNPAVSADGNVVVWEKCQLDRTGCDIYAATQTAPGVFAARLVSGTGEDRFPDTNGQLIVYISDKNGENDIYFQRVDGSNEMHLSIPGDQRDLRMSGNLLVFESQMPDRSHDIFVYDLTTARLYQATNTPEVSETLSDIAAGCAGINRIVYAIPGNGAFDVYGFTFQLSDSINDQLNDLISLVRSFNLHDGTEASLITKLQDALAAVNTSNTAIACDSLTAFINASQAQLGKKLTAGEVQHLVESATQVKSDLGCQ
jgi:hypothetical protein